MPPKKNKEQAKWLEENTEAKDWLIELERRSGNTAKNRRFHLFHYCRFLKKQKGIASVKQLLNEYKQLKKEGNEYQHNKYVKEFLFSPQNIKKSYSWREGFLGTIREFYRYNYCPLPDEKMDLRNTQIDALHLLEESALKPMTLAYFKRLISPAKIREKSMLLTMLQSGMGVGELTKQFNVCLCSPEIIKKRGHICAPANVMRQLRQDKHPPIKVHPLVAYKQRNTNDKRVIYFTFIGKDAIDLLKQYLQFRKELVLNSMKQLEQLKQREKANHYLHAWEKVRIEQLEERLKEITPECKDGEPIYITNLLNPVGEHNIQHIVRILKKQTGLLDRSFTPHTCRDLFKTECDHVGVKDTISEYWIRHKLDKYGYNQLDKMHPEDFEKEYAKVEAELNIFSASSEGLQKQFGQEREKRLELETKLEKLEKFITSVAPKQAPELEYYDEVVDFIRVNMPKPNAEIKDEEIKDVFYDTLIGQDNIVVEIRGYLNKKGEFVEVKGQIIKKLWVP